MRYAHIWQAVLGTPWAILPSSLTTILSILEYHSAGGLLTADEIRERVSAGRATTASPRPAGIAVLPLMGVISHRMGLVSESSGGISTERFAQMFRAALADPAVRAIVLDVDSPGGTVNGVEELAGEIYRARGSKPVSAVANSMAASAAYWIASAADELIVTPSGEVGSIGVLAAHEDVSGEQERRGRRVSLVSAGKYKTEGNPYEPLTTEARAAIQGRVDEYYGTFTRAVARQRSTTVETVRGGFGEGRLVSAKRAVELGMADRVATLDDTISRLAGSRPGRSTANAAETQRRLLLLGA